MALENYDVLENLKEQLTKINADMTTLTNTRYKLMGAIEVLEQIESLIMVYQSELKERTAKRLAKEKDKGSDMDDLINVE